MPSLEWMQHEWMQHEWMQYVVPVAAMLGSGLVAGFMAGLFGIGGGFVVVPAIAMILSVFSEGESDHIMHVAIGTSLGTIVLTSLRSVQAHARRGAVDFAILRAWSPWVVVGVALGVVVAKFMDGRSLRLVFAVGVFFMGLHFLFPRLGKSGPIRKDLPRGVARAGLGSFLGGLSALLGIGGGTPAILLMTLSGVPMHRAVATAAGFGTVIAVPGVIGHMLIGWGTQGLPFGSLGFVNVTGLLAVTAASVLTAPMGVALAHSLDASRLKRAFGVYLLFTSGLMLHGYFKSPAAEHSRDTVARRTAPTSAVPAHN